MNTRNNTSLRILLFLCGLLLAAPLAQAQAAQDLQSLLWPQGYPPASAADQRAGVANNTQLPTLVRPASPAPAPSQAGEGTIRRVTLPAGIKAVALSFDACELQSTVSGFDVALVQTLRQHKAPATFFAGGKWMRSHPERSLQLMATEGFELGNHAWSHGNFGIMDIQKATQQVQWTQAIYEQFYAELAARAERAIDITAAQGTDKKAQRAALMSHIPARMSLFRLPYGRCRPETLSLVHNLGLRVIQWDVIGEVEKNNAAPTVAHKVAAQVRPGSIILMHANLVPQGTAALTAQLIPLLRAQGYSLVTVSQLLTMGTPLHVQEGYFSHPGDNLQLDTQFGIDGTGVRRK